MSWEVETDGPEPELVLRWKESGGPPVQNPSPKGGFGSRLIRMGLTGTGGTDERFLPLGFQAVFRAPMSSIQAR